MGRFLSWLFGGLQKEAASKHPSKISARPDSKTPSAPKMSGSWLQWPTLAPGNEQEVVGESNYQPALEKVALGRTEKGANRSLVMAQLILEPSNVYDTNAVRVEVEGKVVGYIPKTVARRFHKVIKELNSERVPAFCRAELRGGWERSPKDRGNFGIVLDVKLPLRRFSAQNEPLLPEGNLVHVRTLEKSAPELKKLADSKRKGAFLIAEMLEPLEESTLDNKNVSKINIFIEGLLVGVLTEAMTERYLRLVQAARKAGVPATCHAQLEAPTKTSPNGSMRLLVVHPDKILGSDNQSIQEIQ